MEILLSVNLDTTTMANNSQPSIMNIVCRWDVMISLLMTVLMMGSVVSVITMMMDTLMTISFTILALKKWMTLMHISKEVFMVGKRSSMVVNLEVKQLNNSVEKMSAILMLPRANLSHFHR